MWGEQKLSSTAADIQEVSQKKTVKASSSQWIEKYDHFLFDLGLYYKSSLSLQCYDYPTIRFKFYTNTQNMEENKSTSRGIYFCTFPTSSVGVGIGFRPSLEGLNNTIGIIYYFTRGREKDEAGESEPSAGGFESRIV